ncbi:MAG TPA: hypothetical protein VJ201_01075 [Candidatus Babeliales bacterium]|nr:hypothetical protein [Candidatus Babeliales bacterium]
MKNRIFLLMMIVLRCMVFEVSSAKECSKDDDCQEVRGKPYSRMGTCQKKECLITTDCYLRGDGENTGFFRTCRENRCTGQCTNNFECAISTALQTHCCGKGIFACKDGDKVLTKKKGFCRGRI